MLNNIVVDPISGREILKPPTWKDHKSLEENLKYESKTYNNDILECIRGRCSVNELRDFANKLREIGGADVITELLPSNAGNADSCLIANALNFDSKVGPSKWFAGNVADHVDANGHSIWYIQFANEELANKVSEGMAMPVLHIRTDYEGNKIYRHSLLVLPYKIYAAAFAFDSRLDVELNTFIV